MFFRIRHLEFHLTSAYERVIGEKFFWTTTHGSSRWIKLHTFTLIISPTKQ